MAHISILLPPCVFHSIFCHHFSSLWFFETFTVLPEGKTRFPILLGFDIASLVNWCPAFQDHYIITIIIIIIIIYLSWSWATWLTRSGLMYPEVSSKVYNDSFCQLGSRISSLWVIYFEAFYLHVVSIFSCIPVICPKLVLFLTPLQFVYLFCNLSKCILLLFSCISSLFSPEMLNAN